MFSSFDADTGICEIGGWLIPEAEGHGLITRAFRHMIGWAIELRGMNRVELRASPENTRAGTIAQRLRMTHEATLRSAFTVNGTHHASEVWAILATEWPKR
ncbi:MAG TPA: hypothetical protein DGG94_23020 [Micromonosporaceae bacterium]|nr:hypothetical protein [Micromonosporaceae bacterium]